METSDYTKFIISAYMNSFGHFIPSVREISIEEMTIMFKDELISKQKRTESDYFITEIAFFKHCLFSAQDLFEKVGCYPYIEINNLINQIKVNKNNNILVDELNKKIKELDRQDFLFPIEKLNLGMYGFISSNGVECIIDLVNELYMNTTNFIKIKNNVINSPVINRNQWDNITYELFIYLIDNYTKTGKVKYSNIYKYLKNINKNSYAFNFTQRKYKEYILENYDVKITTFGTANYEYDDKEKPILNGLEQYFRQQSPI
jgi:hypothetical protein